jgi:hypothetical protein
MNSYPLRIMVYKLNHHFAESPTERKTSSSMEFLTRKSRSLSTRETRIVPAPTKLHAFLALPNGPFHESFPSALRTYNMTTVTSMTFCPHSVGAITKDKRLITRQHVYKTDTHATFLYGCPKAPYSWQWAIPHNVLSKVAEQDELEYYPAKHQSRVDCIILLLSKENPAGTGNQTRQKPVDSIKTSTCCHKT